MADDQSHPNRQGETIISPSDELMNFLAEQQRLAEQQDPVNTTSNPSQPSLQLHDNQSVPNPTPSPHSTTDDLEARMQAILNRTTQTQPVPSQLAPTPTQPQFLNQSQGNITQSDPQAVPVMFASISSAVVEPAQFTQPLPDTELDTMPKKRQLSSKAIGLGLIIIGLGIIAALAINGNIYIPGSSNPPVYNPQNDDNSLSLDSRTITRTTSISTALASCRTNTGIYSPCDTIDKLVTAQYYQGSIEGDQIDIKVASNQNGAMVYGLLRSTSRPCDTGNGSKHFIVSLNGQSYPNNDALIVCTDSTPSFSDIK